MIGAALARGIELLVRRAGTRFLLAAAAAAAAAAALLLSCSQTHTEILIVKFDNYVGTVRGFSLNRWR